MLENAEYDFRYDLNVGLTMESLGNRDRLLNTIALYYTVIRNKAQLIRGLSVLGILELLQKNPHKAKDLLVFQRPAKLIADHMISMFTPQLSPVGSNAREDEEHVNLLWIHFLQLIESVSNLFVFCIGNTLSSVRWPSLIH